MTNGSWQRAPEFFRPCRRRLLDTLPLFAPLDQLLCAGGYCAIGGKIYGLQARRRDVIAFSSSTIVDFGVRLCRGWWRKRLFLESFDLHIATVWRGSLRSILGLEIACAKSCSLAVKYSHSNSRCCSALVGTPLTTIVVGSDQTGSGTAYTAGAKHFASAHGAWQTGPKGLHVVVRMHLRRLRFAGTDGAFLNCDETGPPRD